MSDQDSDPANIPASRQRLEDQRPLSRRPRPADIGDLPVVDAPVRRRAPAAAPPRRLGWQAPGVVPLLWTVIGLLVVVAIGLTVAIVVGVFTPKQAPVAVAASAQGSAPAASAPATPKIEVTKRQAFGDWIYACIKVPNSADTRCQISQQLSDSATKQPLFAWRITQDGQGGLVGEWETRSGILVDRGIVMDMGTEKPVTIPFQACLPQGCTAVAKLAPEVISAMSKAGNASATISPVGGKPVKLTLSVKGLSDALAALQPAQTPPPPTAAAPAAPAAAVPPKPSK